MEPKFILNARKGNLTGQSFEFDRRDCCIIGRARDCGLQIPSDKDHRTISRYHCLLDINPPYATIRDFGSLNGTYINGERIGRRERDMLPEEAREIGFPEHDLNDGDTIRIGKTVFQVEIFEPPMPTTAIPPVQLARDALGSLLLKTMQLAESQEHLRALRGYSIIKELGKGGFGAVYLAKHRETNRLEAIKIMLPQIAMRQRAREDFELEAHNTSSLSHENIVKLNEFGNSEGLFFFTLEYCDGGSVIDCMKKDGLFDEKQACRLILPVLRGLGYAHQAPVKVRLKDGTIQDYRGLVHRDIKPHNIFLMKSANSFIPKLGDYGLAKAFDAAGFSGRTLTGTVAGTPYFMPRQQVLEYCELKPPGDVWALAASLYFMLTGEAPRDFSDPDRDPFQVILNTNAIPVRQRNPRISKRLASVIDRALDERNNSCHFCTAEELHEELLKVT